MLISIETHMTCDFPVGEGVRTLYPPSRSALAKMFSSLVTFIHYAMVLSFLKANLVRY